MTDTVIALLGYVLLFLTLTGGIVMFRGYNSMVHNRAVNNYRPDGTDVGGFGQRLIRTHANSYENFGFFAALVLLAIATGNTDITEPLALIFLAARVAQAIVHLISTSNMAVLVRAFFYATQILILLYWVFSLGARLIS